ncbi:hypothetical protein C1645_792839 [Glomus cerebriforme]|uniref:Uncharacterized protein n=1 Tax=Glomus cerebriforme TaxID=658196 RepID=A0A397S1I9_9GLOM|nr:hypothetical protein C1645_792839 [Glomus cerebriforme]
MIVPKSCKRKTCDIPHSDNGSVVRGEIIQKSCPVHFMKFVPDNIVNCPFVALVCIGIHNHPPPVPERTPANIKSNLQVLIEKQFMMILLLLPDLYFQAI